jgi:class 3 adenylate cyclase/predicted ATPase
VRLLPLMVTSNDRGPGLAYSKPAPAIDVQDEGVLTMSLDVADWLRGLGLHQYISAFRDNAIDAELLSSLTAEDLKDIGVTLVGHRRRLLDAIAALRSEPSLTADPDAAVEPGGSAQASATAPRSTDAERRQLTVMFCDLVGSTALSTQLDPEELSDVLGAFQKACVNAVTRFGGSVAKYMGDGALVYFGYPEAHEDDAERAVRAGLALIETMASMPLSVALRPRVRIGVATGLVVVGELIGEGSARERVAVGETLNLAARIQAVASPDSVAVSELTHRLAGAAFEYEELGPHELKGFPDAARLWRVAGESTARGRFDSRVAGGLTPLVGRAEEIALLRRCWDHATAGDGQLILLSAPAGFGKSRMTQAFREHLDDPAMPGSYVTCLQYHGSPFHVNSAFYPFIRQLEWAAGIVRTDTGSQKLDKLEAVLEGSAESKTEAAALAADLLSIPFGERYPPLHLTEVVQKQRTMEMLEDQLVLLSDRGPVLIIFEDTHWIDPTSVQLMDRIIRRVIDLPVMIIVTYRPEFTPVWQDLAHATILKLNHLGRSQVADLIHKTAGGKALPEAIVAQIAARSQGVPLFIEEITRAILESGDLEEDNERYVLRGSIRDFAIPSTLRDSLIARLDRLGVAKDVALTASIIGREFSYEMLDAVARVPQAVLLEGLEQLVRSDLLGQRGAPPRSHYNFKHALIRDAAFQCVLNTRKRELHERIADVLASRFPEVAETEPELLAHHYTEANLVDRALAYWRMAAERAATRLSYIEALGHIDRATKLVAALPESTERDEWELIFLVIEGPSRMALDGWDSPPAKLLYEKARATAERLGRPTEVFRSVWGLWMGAHTSGQHARAHELLQEIFGLLTRTKDPEYVVQAHHAGGSQMVAEGAPRAALIHVDHLLTNYQMNVHGNLAMTYGAHDPGCCSLGMRALSLTMLGHLDQVEDALRQGLDLSQRLDHKPSLSQTHMFCAETYLILNRMEQAAAHLNICLPLAAKYSLANYLIPAQIMQGWVLVLRGEVEAGVRQAEAALETLTSVPSRRFHLPIRIGIVGLTKAAAGDIDGALELFVSALEAASTTGERWYEPELLRFKAEMLLALPDQRANEAEQCLEAAIELARQQEAKFWELRAAVALAKLWADQGRRDAGRDLLAPRYAGFTEGFNTADLKEAKTLLDALA